MIRFCLLASGSRGNAALIMRQDEGLLVDVGISGRELFRRLREVNVDPEQIRAILITHEHGDHILGAGVTARRLGVPLFGTPATLDAAAARLGDVPHVELFQAGQTIRLLGMELRTFPLSHDAVDPVGLVVESDGLRLGFAQDLGFVSRLVLQRLRRCNGLIFESNHDEKMLKEGPYPWPTKQRILSRKGHLSNRAAMKALETLLDGGVQHLMLSHLSETNNHAGIVRECVLELLERKALQPTVQIGRQDCATRLVEVLP
jgi:phosphoribosyl 1,2-cyclic phosphodiesterase